MGRTGRRCGEGSIWQGDRMVAVASEICDGCGVALTDDFDQFQALCIRCLDLAFKKRTKGSGTQLRAYPKSLEPNDRRRNEVESFRADVRAIIGLKWRSGPRALSQMSDDIAVKAARISGKNRIPYLDSILRGLEYTGRSPVSDVVKEEIRRYSRGPGTTKASVVGGGLPTLGNRK